MIKKILTIILLIYSSTAFADTKLYLTGSANTGYAHNPDLKQFMDQSEESYNEPGSNTDKIQRKDADRQYGYSFEPRLFFGNIGFSIFIGKQNLSKGKLSVYSSSEGFWSESYKISAITLGSNLFYKFNLSRNKRYWIILGTGFTYYRAKLDMEFCSEHNLIMPPPLTDTSYEATGFGIQAKTELHFAFNQRLDSIFIGIEGKKCRDIKFEAQFDDGTGNIIEFDTKTSFTGFTVYAGLSVNIF